MISFHKLSVNYFSLAIFKSVISRIKFPLSAQLHVQLWASGQAFHPESQGLHIWVTRRDMSGITEEPESSYPVTSMRITDKLIHLVTGGTKIVVLLKIAVYSTYKSRRQEVTVPPRKMWFNELSKEEPSSLGECQIKDRRRIQKGPTNTPHMRRTEDCLSPPLITSSSVNLWFSPSLLKFIYSYSVTQKIFIY